MLNGRTILIWFAVTCSLTAATMLLNKSASDTTPAPTACAGAALPPGQVQQTQSRTLLDAAIRDWHAATSEERLGTAVAIIAGKSSSIGPMKPHACAHELSRCITEATRDMIMDNARVMAVAEACLQMLE